MAADITNAILDLLIERLPPAVNEGLLSTDPIYLTSIERGPLQDDPTMRATFLTVAPDEERGFRKPVVAVREDDYLVRANLPRYEVGGDFLFVNYFVIRGWTPISGDKEAVYLTGGRFLRRVETALMRLARDGGFADITTDDEMETTAGLDQTFALSQSSFDTIGGESEWYARVLLHFHVYSRVRNDYWRA